MVVTGRPDAWIGDSITVRRMGLADLAWVVAQHRSHFPDNVIGRLGLGLLTRYYRTFLDSTFAMATVAEVSGVRAGFLVGVLDTAAHRQLMWQFHGFSLGAATLRAFLRHPVLGAGILRRRLSLRLRPVRADPVLAERVAVLSHVAVDPARQGQGLGGMMVDQFLTAAAAAGADRVCVATADHAPRAARIYLHRGFVLTSRSRTFDGRYIRLYDRSTHPSTTR
jgi:ribosomal protein S18 acetylase RimI-like enzyme